MVSLAGYLRSIAKKGVYDKDDIVQKFVAWEIEDKYMVMCHQKEAWLKDAGEYEYYALKCAKRGNDVYVRRVENRLFGIKQRCQDVTFNFWGNPYTRILFVTFTYDIKLCSFVDAWTNLGTEFNRAKANIRKQFVAFSVLRTWESYENGFPHVHAILIFKDYKFKVFPSYELKKNGKTRLVWRIEEKDIIQKYWHSWVDVKAIEDLQGGIRYLEKYIMKCAEFDKRDKKGTLTLALCWVLRKKAFYVSGQFRQALSDLIATLCSSKTRKIQLNLLNEELSSNPWRVLGFIGVSLLDFDVEIWTIKLTAKQMQRVFEEWEKANHYE